jgi:hypothetical protein
MATRIKITCGAVEIPAILNDTVAAKDFMTRLPFQVDGFRSDIDYCCTASEGKCDPSEKQAGWKNGDVNLSGGWFSILFDGEETSKSYKDMMIIAYIGQEYLKLVKELPKKVHFTVTLAS